MSDCLRNSKDFTHLGSYVFAGRGGGVANCTFRGEHLRMKEKKGNGRKKDIYQNDVIRSIPNAIYFLQESKDGQ